MINLKWEKGISARNATNLLLNVGPGENCKEDFTVK